MLNFQRFKRRPSTWFKSKTAHFYLQPLFNALNMLNGIGIDIFNPFCWALNDRLNPPRREP